MSLQLLLGGSGYGKSHDIYDQVIRASIVHPEKYYFILVPEQYTMQVQKRIVELHPDHATMNIDVVSFGRLAYRIFDELNMETPTVLDDIGKSMVLRRVVAKEKSKLKVFQGNAEKTGFVSEMKSTISEFMQYHITPEILGQVSGGLLHRPALQGKLEDIGCIYQSFMDYIGEKYITTEQILDRLVDVVGDSALVQRSEFYLDAFTGFTPSQYALIREILLMKVRMVISLTVDVREDVYTRGKAYDLFHLTRDTIHRLNHLCSQSGIEREEDIQLTQQHRYVATSPVGLVEKNLYRNYTPDACEDTDDGQLRLLAAATPVQELTYVAEEIHRLVRQGYRYREIAIVAGSLPVYSHVVENAMHKAEIPVFIDETKDVLSNGLVEFIRALLDVIVMDFSYDAIFRCLKTGWIRISRWDMDMLENYVLATGVRGYKMWSSTFVRRYRGLSKEDLVYVNHVREAVMAWFGPLWEGFHDEAGTASGYSRVLLSWIEDRELEAMIAEKEAWFETHDQMDRAKEYHQIYRVLTDLLKRMDEILVDEKMTLKAYKDVLDAGLNEARIGIIPPGMDQVIVGDLRRTRLGDISVLFFVGVNEGLVPAEVRSGGLINDKDKDLLKNLKIELAPTGKQDQYTERFYIYAMITNPSKYLYLSYVRSDSSGKSMLPSTLIGRIEKIVPTLQAEDMLSQQASHIYSISAAKRYIADQLHDVEGKVRDKTWYDIYYWMVQRYKKQLDHYMHMAFGIHEDIPLTKSAVRALYGRQLEGSVTMLEQYANCAYEHFLNYGLELRERQEYHFGAPDMGMLFHSVLELFTKRLMHSEENWHTISNTQREQLVTDCVRDVVADDHYLVLMDNYRNRHMISRLERMSQRTVWALQKQIVRGSFEPTDVELRFGSADDHDALSLALSEEEVLKLSGVIDRMDTYEDHEKTFVRIIDYKTGQKKFDLTALFYGLQLQLVVYMEAAMDLRQSKDAERRVVPAGILYYNIDDPMVKGESASIYGLGEEEQLTDGQLDTERLKALRMNGLINENEDIPFLMEHHLSGKSDILPLELTKTGEISKKSSVATTEQFNILFEYAKAKVTSLGRHILDGDIDVRPYRSGKQDGCTYCPYHEVCSFDENMEGYQSRNLPKLPKDDIFTMMKREVDHEYDMDK